VKLLDKQGRLFGWINLIDLVIVLTVAVLVAAAYARLTMPYRVAPSYAAPENVHWIEIDLQMPAGRDWLIPLVQPGLQERDPRSGQPVAEIVSCTAKDGVFTARLRVQAVGDPSSRLLFKNKRLAPGQTLRIETETCVLDGVVTRVLPDGG